MWGLSSTVVSDLALGIDIGGTTIKAAALRSNQILWTSRSSSFSRPDMPTLIAALRQAVVSLDQPPRHIGLCVPGLLDESRQRITYAANLPGLSELPLRELIERAMGASDAALSIVNDANATAFDLYSMRQPRGRLLVLAIGTGVGNSVLDDGKPLYVEGDSAGHLGQMDISLEGPDVIGPDGGRGGLEAYIGGGALAARYGSDPATKIQIGDPAFLALVRTIRVCHALYRPHHICLAGGTGIRLAPLLPPLRQAVESNLTSLARPAWTLSCADHDFHAAAGAARIAVSPVWR
jgi:predicted NBD/HSP70 family sugar kinase